MCVCVWASEPLGQSPGEDASQSQAGDEDEDDAVAVGAHWWYALNGRHRQFRETVYLWRHICDHVVWTSIWLNILEAYSVILNGLENNQTKQAVHVAAECFDNYDNDNAFIFLIIVINTEKRGDYWGQRGSL